MNTFPPLPKPASVSAIDTDSGTVETCDLYTSEQMYDYLEADRAQRQDAETWSLYIASMVEAYLQSQPAADKREAAIAGIISRRLWALPERAQRQAVQEPRFWYKPNPASVRDLSFYRTQTYTEPLYTAAPQPAQVPLTEQQLSIVLAKTNFTYDPTKFARAIEQAHGICPA